MSTARFFREVTASMRDGSPLDRDERMQEAYEAVRDRWVACKDYEPLTKAVVGNWTSGNCVDYMVPLSEALIADGRMDLHRHLWTSTVKRQVATFFRELSWIRQKKPTFAHLIALDTNGFDEFNPASYTDHERAAAFLLQRLVRDLDRWRNELDIAELCTAEPDQVQASLEAMKLPNITVNKLPPNSSSKPTPLRGAAKLRCKQGAASLDWAKMT